MRRTKRAGFHTIDLPTEPPTPDELSLHLPRELLNRFGPLVTMSPQGKSDYEELLREAARVMPDELRGAFLQIGHKAVSRALRDRKGARFVEEVLTEAIMETLSRNPSERRHESVRLSSD